MRVRSTRLKNFGKDLGYKKKGTPKDSLLRKSFPPPTLKMKKRQSYQELFFDFTLSPI
jgi:hypothetical protein